MRLRDTSVTQARQRVAFDVNINTATDGSMSTRHKLHGQHCTSACFHVYQAALQGETLAHTCCRPPSDMVLKPGHASFFSSSGELR
eukprot:1158060-Pelagomonas_calceolata.AAC.14